MTTIDDFDIRTEIGPLLRRCDRHSLDLYESSVGPDAPTRQQVGVMLVIHQLKEPTQVQISQRSGIDRSTISGIVRRLAKNGLVQLNPSLSDNRAVTHSLTIDGLAVLNKSMKVLIENQAKRSEEHTSELQSLMRISYAVFCLKKK